jgi:hypothetical protein
MQQELGEQRNCQVSLVIIYVVFGMFIKNEEIIDPSNYKPMHLYNPGVVAAGDVSRLKTKTSGYLRVVFK